MSCIALFDKNGERYTSIIKGIHFDDEEKKAGIIKKLRAEAAENGYNEELIDVEISKEDQKLYATNKYIRDSATGKPILRPPYVPTIKELAEAKWNEIKTARDDAEQAGCPYMGKAIDSDQLSVQRVSIAVQAAIGAGAENFTIDWTMQDNTITTMTAEQVIGMSAALAAYSNALHAKARQLRAGIDAQVQKYEKGKISEADARTAISALKYEP